MWLFSFDAFDRGFGALLDRGRKSSVYSVRLLSYGLNVGRDSEGALAASGKRGTSIMLSTGMRVALKSGEH